MQDEADEIETLMAQRQREMIKVQDLQAVLVGPPEPKKHAKRGAKEVVLRGTKKKKGKEWILSDAQARGIIIGAILDYYAEFEESFHIPIWL